MKNTGLYFSLILIIGFSFISFTSSKTDEKTLAIKAVVASPKKVGVPDSTNPYYIVVDKSDYELKVYDEEGWLATYPVVFGSKDLRDKWRQGDRRTPDGEFKIVLKKIHHKWGPELLLDYPNRESVERFNQRKATGIIPKTAKIGDGIAIHATRPEEEWTVDNFYNWTDGCVSVKYTEMKDLFSYIPVGTPVSIQQ